MLSRPATVYSGGDRSWLHAGCSAQRREAGHKVIDRVTGQNPQLAPPWAARSESSPHGRADPAMQPRSLPMLAFRARFLIDGQRFSGGPLP
jgi:hypothetical protein